MKNPLINDSCYASVGQRKYVLKCIDFSVNEKYNFKEKNQRGGLL